MLEKRYAEPVYYLENPNDNNNKETTIRGGWILELTIEPNIPQGLPKSPPTKENLDANNEEKQKN
jgi:hypothetical protein